MISCENVDSTFICSDDALYRLLANFPVKLMPGFFTMFRCSFGKLNAWLWNGLEVWGASLQTFFELIPPFRVRLMVAREMTIPCWWNSWSWISSRNMLGEWSKTPGCTNVYTDQIIQVRRQVECRLTDTAAVDIIGALPLYFRSLQTSPISDQVLLTHWTTVKGILSSIAILVEE